MDNRNMRFRQRIKALKQQQNKPVMVSIPGEDGAAHIKFVSVTEIETLRAMYGEKLNVFGQEA